MKRAALALVALASLLSSGCFGGREVGPLVSVAPLTYQDPATDGWRLVRDDSGSGGGLVLALVGPQGTRTRGASLTLAVDGNLATFSPFPDGTFVQNPGVYVTTTYPGESASLRLQPARVKGNTLTAGIFQKNADEPAKDSGTPLLRVALTPTAAMPSGTVVPLLILKAAVIPEDMAAANFKPEAIAVAVGRVSAR